MAFAKVGVPMQQTGTFELKREPEKKPQQEQKPQEKSSK